VPKAKLPGLKSWGHAPALAWTLLFFVLPLIAMLVMSFSARVDGKIELTWTLDNYRAFLTRAYGTFVGALWNSIEVTVITTIVSVVVAYPLAYILAYKVPKQWQRFALVLTVLPFWTSYVVRSYSWLLVLSENGVINQFLLWSGILDTPVGMGNSRFATVLGFVHFFAMLLTLTIYANLVQIKDSYRKAAADLGANGWQAFWHVTLPLSLPGVSVGAFLTFVLAIGDYITPQILGGSKEMLLPQAVMLQIGRQADFPLASALSMILMLVITAAFLVFAKRLKMERV
jgi:spermidine/putrescine transport system permease protein